jgi:hypothetical protein
MAHVARRCAAIAFTGLLVWAGTRSLPPPAQTLPASPARSQAGTTQLPRLAGTQTRNVIFVLVDDLRFDAMGFMKHPWLETPNLDALARSGVHFRNAFVTTALCSPSRASILTGQYAHRHRVVDNVSPMPPGNLFFPQYLRRPGTTRPLSASGTWVARAMRRSPDSTAGSASAARAPTCRAATG